MTRDETSPDSILPPAPDPPPILEQAGRGQGVRRRRSGPPWRPDGNSVPPAGLARSRGGDLPPTRIGPYQLLQKIDEGSRGLVYLAEPGAPGAARVALKLIKPGQEGPEMTTRLEAERQVLALLRHPSIAGVLDAGISESGSPFFVMELVFGPPLTRYCDDRNLSLAARLGLFLQVCDAAQHAHENGIFHHNLKPSKILVILRDGVPLPKVIDFGLDRATQGWRPGNEAERRADLRSLGFLLSELLVGRPPIDLPFLGRTMLDELLRQRPGSLLPSSRLDALTESVQASVAWRRDTGPAELHAVLRDGLDAIVLRCLQSESGNRYASAAGLAADLRRHLPATPP